jgi:hypothetical protein
VQCAGEVGQKAEGAGQRERDAQQWQRSRKAVQGKWQRKKLPICDKSQKAKYSFNQMAINSIEHRSLSFSIYHMFPFITFFHLKREASWAKRKNSIYVMLCTKAKKIEAKRGKEMRKNFFLLEHENSCETDLVSLNFSSKQK